MTVIRELRLTQDVELKVRVNLPKGLRDEIG